MTGLNTNQQFVQEFKTETLNLLDQSMIKIRNCFRQLPQDAVWWRPTDNDNSIGNLILHSCGNLRQWGINGILEQTDNRQRAEEFSNDVDVSKDALLNLCDVTINACRDTITQLTDTDLLSTRRIQGFEVTILTAILHTTTHFAGHTHQIVLLTRLQLGERYEFAWIPGAEDNNLPL